MFLFRKRGKRVAEKFDFDKLIEGFTEEKNIGMTAKDYLSRLDVDEQIKAKAEGILLEYEVLYKPEMMEEILIRNACFNSVEGHKHTNMITSRMIDDTPYICMISLMPGNIYKTKVICQETDEFNRKHIKDMYDVYLKHMNEWKNLQMSGEMPLDEDKKIVFHTSNSHEFILRIIQDVDDKSKDIGIRLMNFSPLECYLKLGVITINGASTLYEKDFIGKGYGRQMYDAVDKILLYQQIPHGYAGAPYNLSKDSTRFWEKRNQHRVTPVYTEVIESQKDLIGDINDRLNGIHVIRPNSLRKSNIIEGYFLSQLPEINIQQVSKDLYIINTNKVRLISPSVNSSNMNTENIFITPEEFRHQLSQAFGQKNNEVLCNQDNVDYVLSVMKKYYPDMDFMNDLYSEATATLKI